MKNSIIKKLIIFLIVFIVAFILSMYLSSTDEMQNRYNDIESLLIPTTDKGNVDFDKMEISDHQYIAYVLISEARLKKNPKIINDLTLYLINHSDENNDGEIGWGLGYSWDAFSDGTINPEWHAYAIETVNVLDAYVETLNSKVLSSELSEVVKSQIHDTVMLWNQKYWSDKGKNNEEFFYWYSISENDAIGSINIDAKMVGTEAKILNQYAEVFTDNEKNYIYNKIDKTYRKIMQKSYYSDGILVWDYLEKIDSSPNDAIHHGFILEGIKDYQQYRLNEKTWNSSYGDYIDNCIKDNIIYSTPDFKNAQCFDTGAIRWISSKDIQKEVLLKSYDLYYNTNTEKRQLAFFLNALSLYLNDN